jgi:lipopolysaccharide transport system ATP-binding protein
MSSEIAIRAGGLGKCYPIFDQPEDRLKQMLVRGRHKYYREFWAVRNVDLDVYRGETLGIVGRNGSGKSTLLQLICGTLTPTIGELTVNGRVAALLELGAGFSPEFTGRENVYMNGSILGLGRDQIDRRFDSIAAFADIGSFIDQPIKMYSSGMYARLAFAIAINVDPDILIVDEALSVGDEAFQRKCFARIKVIREKGATILFVSHAAQIVIELCDRAVLLDAGERILTGPPKKIVSYYYKLLYAPADRALSIREGIQRLDASNEAEGRLDGLPTAAGSGVNEIEEEAEFDESLRPKSTVEYASKGARIRDVHIEDKNGHRVNVLVHGDDYWYCYVVDFEKACFGVSFGMLLKTVTGLGISGFTSHREDECIEEVHAGESVRVRFRFQNRFSAGVYFANAGVEAAVEEGRGYVHRVLDATMFRVKPFRFRQPVPTGLVDFSASDGRGVSVESVGAAESARFMGSR